MNLILYGSGKRCEILIELIKKSDINIVKVVDSNPEKWGNDIRGYKVEPCSVLSSLTDYCICVTFYSSNLVEPVWLDLEKIGFLKKRIFSFHELILLLYDNNNDICVHSCVRKHASLVIFDGAWPMKLGGVESWLRYIVPTLGKNGIENVYLATELKETQSDTNYIMDFCLYDTPDFSVECVSKCIKFIENKLPCTMVFSRVDELLLAAALVKNKYPNEIRIIMTVHGACDGTYRDVLSYKKYIDFYMCVSNGIKMHIINNGIDMKIIDTMTCPVRYNDNLLHRYSTDLMKPIHIGYAGRLEIREKRIDILRALINKLEEKGINYIMSIAGNGNEYCNLQSFIIENKLENRVKLLGILPNDKMGEFWNKQDIAINTSDNEGRPLSNIEAMLHGAVPIVTNTIGIRDDVYDCKNGFIVPLNDVDTMTERIMYLYNNRMLIKEYGNAARKEMIKKVDLNNHIIQWKSILDKISV